MLSNRVVDHLRGVIEAPDLRNTKYAVIEELGRGGMGVVYLARDHGLGRNVALKVLNSADEARTLASLEHPGIVPVHDVGTLPDGRIYYAMRFVQGTRLDAFRRGTHSLADRLRVFIRICEPVAFAHSHGLIHRDLKPENVIIGSFGEVLVLDWGVARRTDSLAATMAGTPGYMPPEQLAGITDERTDIYALGKVLEHLLDAVDPKPVHAIAAKASDPDRLLRYSSVTELAEDAMRFLDQQAVMAYRESLFERASRWATRNRTFVAIILTYVLARTMIIFFARH